jgi:hypothetical protein
MEISKDFLEQLHSVDQTLGAWFDKDHDTLNVWSDRAGKKDLVLQLKREFGELYSEMKYRCVAKLREMDIWKLYGGAKEYERALRLSEESHREKKKKEWTHKRGELFKENKRMIREAMENAKSGRLQEGTGLHQDKNYIVRP